MRRVESTQINLDIVSRIKRRGEKKETQFPHNFNRKKLNIHTSLSAVNSDTESNRNSNNNKQNKYKKYGK